MMMHMRGRLAIGGAGVLLVVLSMYFCCPLAPVAAPQPCCAKECASASVPAPTAVIVAAKRVARPLAIIATRSSASAAPVASLSLDTPGATAPHRFDPLTTIQLRI
jgi:hypothetical protein